MGASVLYSSTDVGAPVLFDGVGTLATVLEKCLVTGYGEKSGLGWTMEFQSPDGKVKVFRNKGTGLFLKVDNSVNYAATGMAVKIEVFEAMRAWDIGYLRTPETGVNQYFAYANTKVGTRALKWKVIGDDKGFWIVTEFSTTANNFAASYFGDYIPYHLENKSNWLSFTHTGIEVTHGHFYCPNSVLNGHIRIPRGYQNNLPPTSANMYSGCGRVNTSSADIAYNSLGYPSWMSSVAYLSSPSSIFAKPYMATTTGSISTMIGEIPGLLECVSWTPSGNIVKQSGNADVRVFWINNTAKIGILIGEGFR